MGAAPGAFFGRGACRGEKAGCHRLLIVGAAFELNWLFVLAVRLAGALPKKPPISQTR